MITPEYAVECLKKGFERYIRQSRINATIKCSATTVSFYVDKTPNNKRTNARVSDHHPRMQNYASHNQTPWLSDNVSVEFIPPKTKADKQFRPRVKQNVNGTIQPFSVTVYQYNPNILEGQDLLEIFKSIVVFLNGNGYSDPFTDTNKQAIVKPRQANIKPNKMSKTPTNECGTRMSESRLTYIAEQCMKEVVVDSKIQSLIREYLYSRVPLMESAKTSVRMNEGEFKEMVKYVAKSIINEEYKPIGKRKFKTKDGKIEWESCVTLQDDSGQVCHIAEDDHCYVLFNGDDLSDNDCKHIHYIFPEAVKALQSLPLP